MPEQLITIGTYSTPYEANLVKGELEAFDVDAFLADDNTVSMNWLWSNALGGVKVQVAASEGEEARRILKLDAEAADCSEAATFCPECGSGKSHYFLDKRGSFLSWLLLSVPAFPATSKRVCDDCGTKWKA
jgi:membrane protease subunit (stomatin/prohibitin family)